VLRVPTRLGQGQLLGGPVLEVPGELHPIVRRSWLFAEGHDLVVARRVELDQLLTEALTDHAVADHDDRLGGTSDHDCNSNCQVERDTTPPAAPIQVPPPALPPAPSP